jgi:hypothetical protein
MGNHPEILTFFFGLLPPPLWHPHCDGDVLPATKEFLLI